MSDYALLVRFADSMRRHKNKEASARGATEKSLGTMGVTLTLLKDSDLDETQLTPEERTHASQMRNALRAGEFMLGRLAARRSLTQLGLTNIPPILSSESGAPVWPSQFVGSISHTRIPVNETSRTYAAAAVAHSTEVCALGIDIESLNRPLKDGIADRVCSLRELEWTRAAHPSLPHSAAVAGSVDFPALSETQRIIFILAAKEALYKALHPKVGRFFGFSDAEIVFCSHTPTEIQLCTDLHRDFQKGFSASIFSSIIESILVVWVLKK